MKSTIAKFKKYRRSVLQSLLIFYDKKEKMEKFCFTNFTSFGPFGKALKNRALLVFALLTRRNRGVDKYLEILV